MKILLKILKWCGIILGALLALIVLAGLCFKLLSPDPQGPTGKLVDIGGFKLHIDATGVKGNKPTLVIEGGAGMATGSYHWLSEGCRDSMRVVRYDRAGIGYSDPCKTPRDPETVARELHTLLESAGESPPYIMAGHSLGGPFLRVYAELYPDEVSAIVLIDATHPERIKRMNLPSKTSYTFRLWMWTLDAQAGLADLGVLALWDKVMGPILGREAEGLPDEINNRTTDFLYDGKYIRAFAKEMRVFHASLERAGMAREFGTIPIRVFTAVERHPEHEVVLRSRGIDPDKRFRDRVQMQKEYTEMSSDGKQVLIEANHGTIFTIKKNADIICKEILQLAKEISEQTIL